VSAHTFSAADRLGTVGSGAHTADFSRAGAESTVGTETRGSSSESAIAGWGSGAALPFVWVGAAASSTSRTVIFWAASSCNRIPTSYGRGRSPRVQWLMHLGERENSFARRARDRPSTVGSARSSSGVIATEFEFSLARLEHQPTRIARREASHVLRLA